MTTTEDPRVPLHDAATAERYFENGSWSRTATVSRFRDVVAAHPDREAVVGPDQILTYSELDHRSDQIGAWLVGQGLRRGATVLFQTGNSAEAVLAFYALLKAGVVPVATLAAHRSHEIDHVGALVGAAAHLVDASVAGGALIDLARTGRTASIELLLTVGPAPDGFVRLQDQGRDMALVDARRVVDLVQAEIDPQDVVVFQLSGGTTGTPKVIPRFHAEYWNNGLANSRALKRTAHARIAHVLPFIHNAGMVHALLGAHTIGGCFVVLPIGPPDRILTQLLDTGTTDMMVAGPLSPWFDHPLWAALATNLRTVIYAGSKAPAAWFEQSTELGMWAGQVWGMAEGPYTTTPYGAPRQARKESAGAPVHSADEVRILDVLTHDELPTGEVGMLAVRGPSTIAGYFDAEEHNKVAFTPDGFLLTGDLARLVNIDGHLYVSIEGRIKDVISRGGEKFSTEEVEKLLIQHESIAQAAVVAMPDERLGERACAYLVVTDGHEPPTIESIQDHFAGLGVAKFKWPERLEFIDAMPRTNTYKIDKLHLRADIAARVASGTTRQEQV